MVTIDAMGCQKKSAEKIIDGGGDYIFSLKGNHGALHEEVKLFMDDAIVNNGSYDVGIRKDLGAENFSRLRRIALNLLK